MSENVNIVGTSDPPKDCSESIASTMSASTEVSRKKQISECAAPEHDTVEVNADSTVSNINRVQCIIGIGRTEDKGQDNNDEGWETVESKKGRDKKASHQGKGPTEKSGNSSRKNKSKAKNRNRNRQRKNDSSELDSHKKGINSIKGQIEERTRRETLSKKQDDNIRQSLGHRTTLTTSNTSDPTYGSLFKSKTRVQSQETLKMCSVSKSTDSSKNVTSGEAEALKGKSSPPRKQRTVADQNTASTLQETVSATSRSLANIDESSNLQQSSKLLTSTSTNEAAVNMTEVREHSSGSSTLDGTSRSMTPSTRKSSSPPLQTLVGPGNISSANSSVASSLEAPHATRHGSHKHNSSKEDDVGYHLLKVCERLSDDINMFMNRRALALSSRRRERSALLNSLQETVQNIWAGRCHVEMYGSCATQLDLPSSDLDVVVCGLDRIENTSKGKQSFVDDISETSSSPSSVHSQSRSYHHQFYPHLSSNGHRVIRLATELEKVPWAVQVKAIPTASVPVIKILADSSRLPGAAGMDWMLQQQRMAAAVIAAAEFNSGKMPNTYSNHYNSDQSSTHFAKGVNNIHTGNFPMSRHMAAAMSGIPSSPSSSFRSAMPPWRGADVMNGLLSLDITFEGPEHGGLGSTAFSARVIQEACNETGLPPERTPAVQVLMVIKELLAQRKLNEPFSGGLSSYAILLLVVAVVKERRIINRGIERIEKQRQAVERSSVNCDSVEGTKSSTWPYEKQSKTLNCSGKECSSSSWASVAKKSSSNLTKDDSQDEALDDVSSKKSYQATTSNFTKSDVPALSKSTQNYSDSTIQDLSLFPQGSNDVLEVLCSGEPTAGKLLMHFLLFYGRHFDAYTTCIDVSGTHHPDYKAKPDSKVHANTHLSPFTARKAGGTFNPITEVYTVDPIVVYDPLEGAESNNVARSCYAWENIRWTFEQCYNTLSGVVELGVVSNNNRSRSKTWPQQDNTGPTVDSLETSRNVDDLSPLLELLLSF
jgi:DNA polymerase sigma